MSWGWWWLMVGMINSGEIFSGEITFQCREITWVNHFLYGENTFSGRKLLLEITFSSNQNVCSFAVPDPSFRRHDRKILWEKIDEVSGCSKMNSFCRKTRVLWWDWVFVGMQTHIWPSPVTPHECLLNDMMSILYGERTWTDFNITSSIIREVRWILTQSSIFFERNAWRWR